MAHRFLLVLALTAVWAFSPRLAYSQTPLTNDDVVGMVNGKLSLAVIKNAIAGAPTASFDLSTQGLLKLKGAGVDDQIIEAMQARNSNVQTTKGGATPPSAAEAAALPAAVGVFYVQDGKYEAILSETGKGRMGARVLLGPMVKQKNENKVSGGSAAAKLSNPQPKFLLHLPNRDVTKFNMLSMFEVRTDERVLFVVEGRLTGNLNQKVVQVALSEPGPGYVEMSPRAPLAAGEYAIVDYGAKNEPPIAWSFAIR